MTEPQLHVAASCERATVRAQHWRRRPGLSRAVAHSNLARTVILGWASSGSNHGAGLWP